MAATEPLCLLAGINCRQLSKEENILLEVELFMRICDEMKELLKKSYKNYFHVMKFNKDMENDMLEKDFLRCIINDILLTEEYSITGIACYTNTHEDVILDIATGYNTYPSLPLSRKIIELHRTIRPTLYKEIIKKIQQVEAIV